MANKVAAADTHGRLFIRPRSLLEEEEAIVRHNPGGEQWKDVNHADL